MLTSMGFEVHEATCGSDAMAVFEALPELTSTRGRIDLLVTDLMMPDGSGRSLASRLRRLLPTLPVLFVSGFDSHSAGALEGECSSFLTKPFRTTELESVVAQLLGDTPRGV
jgi:CheY-like chemotaxis protein